MFKGSTLLRVKHKLKLFISYFIRSAVEKPVVKGWAVSYLARHPVLKTRLKRIAWGMQHDSFVNQPSIAKAEVMTSAELEFRLRKKGVNNELKSPLESFFY
ncbi:hypothetical protein U724_06870 [Pseudomonas chlororaphis subsp. aurantiaca PB-St2]|nr:hypothetical protein U724_06870 [Pseudomonas chlororaphis subsp. aurantiaca PB-St2]